MGREFEGSSQGNPNTGLSPERLEDTGNIIGEGIEMLGGGRERLKIAFFPKDGVTFCVVNNCNKKKSG